MLPTPTFLPSHVLPRDRPAVWLAPMAGYSDLPFRLLVRSLGPLDLAFTEMLNPFSLLTGGGRKRRNLLATHPDDAPIAFQIYGHDPDRMAAAAAWLADNGAHWIDINMGCPKKKIASRGDGAALLKDPELALAIAAAVRSAVSVPVSAKIRLGWGRTDRTAADLAARLAALDLAAISVHARTAAQMYEGAADITALRDVVHAARPVPVIGNGDVFSPDDARRLVDATGCAGVMLGRGALRDPWLPSRILLAFAGTSTPPPPTPTDYARLLQRHFDAFMACHASPRAVILFRKWIPIYARALHLPRPSMVRLLQYSEPDVLRDEFTRLPAQDGSVTIPSAAGNTNHTHPSPPALC